MVVRLPKKNEVLDLLSRENRAMHAQEIAQKLGVEPMGYGGMLRLLDDLAFNGQVVVRPGQRFLLRDGGKNGGARGSLGSREGTLTVNARGFGFVWSPDAQGDDVFVPEESLAGAMHGDKVEVLLRSRSGRGLEGEIARIVERKTVRVAGVLRRRGKSAWLDPDDTRIRGPIVLADEMDARAGEGNSGNDGDAVIVRITRFPERPDEHAQGKLEAVLGRPGELSVESRKILFLAKIDELHSDNAVREAEAYGLEVPREMLEGREDLTHIPLPTIDPEDARDHDDAVWVERTPEGGYRAWIAIADVSTYVTPGTKLDEEAMIRGCSVYLPDRAIPMLPRALSSNLCSLLPDVLRLCLCVDATLDAGGEIKKTRVVRGYMKSQAKLTYGGVARALGYTENPPRDPKADAMVDGLRVAAELSRLLRGKRMKRGALDFDLPEAKITLDEKGEPSAIGKRSEDLGVKKAYQLIEELMLLANEVVATWAAETKLPVIYRVHLPPDEQKLEKLALMCEALGVPFDVEDTRDTKKLSALVAKFNQHELSQVLNNLLLRSMKQATYDVANLGHFGLASKAYLHFTSPIRRYPDLVTHRAVHAALTHGAIDRSSEAQGKLAEAALAASLAERRSMEAERDVVDLYRAFFMRDKIGEIYEGTVSALVGSGVFVVLDSPFLDVLVRVEDLGESFSVEDDGLRATSARTGESVELGDKLTVEIVEAAILRRTVYARRVGATGERGARPRMPRVKEKRFTGEGRDRPNAQRGRNDRRGAGGSGPSRDAKGKKGASKPSRDRIKKKKSRGRR